MFPRNDAKRDGERDMPERRHARIQASRDQLNDCHKVRAMLSPNFPDNDDIVSAIFEDILTGALKREDVRAPHPDLHRGPQIAQGMPSLAIASCYLSMRVLFEDGSTTLGDTVSRGLSIFRHGCRMDGFAFASDCSG
jgi:hypothetical protein